MLVLPGVLRAVQAVEGLREVLRAGRRGAGQAGEDHFAATRAGAEDVNLVQGKGLRQTAVVC